MTEGGIHNYNGLLDSCNERSRVAHTDPEHTKG